MPKKIEGLFILLVYEMFDIPQKQVMLMKMCLVCEFIMYVIGGKKRLRNKRKITTLSVDSNKTNNKISYDSKGSLKKIKAGLLSISVCDKLHNYFVPSPRLLPCYPLNQKRRGVYVESVTSHLDVTC